MADLAKSTYASTGAPQSVLPPLSGVVHPGTPSGALSGSRVKREWASCGGCGTRWTSARIRHCGGCHRHFAGIAAFDQHRSQYGERGRCLDPAELSGLELRDYAESQAWGGPDMPAEVIAARAKNG